MKKYIQILMATTADKNRWSDAAKREGFPSVSTWIRFVIEERIKEAQK